jgi:REase associating with pPIWI_RE
MQSVRGAKYGCHVPDTESTERFRIPDDQVRYMALYAALVAADALTDPNMPGSRRLEALTRAHGIVMAVRGPAYPLKFAEFRELVRGPVAGLLPPGHDDGGLDSVFAVDPETGERNVDLEALEGEYGTVARLSVGLAHWTWLRDELAENRAYGMFRKGENQHGYVRRREFVIRNAAGLPKTLRSMPREIEDLYVGVPGDRRHGRWCFPCPLCQWPMRVRPGGGVVRVACDDRGHRERGADYRFVRDDDREAPPELTRIHPPPAMPARVRPLAPTAGDVRSQEADRTQMVGPECWHSHVVPGLLELALHDQLLERGVAVHLWPQLDRYDLHVTVEREGRPKREWKIDVKDVVSVDALIRRLERESVREKGLYLVVPDRLESQVKLLERVVSGFGWRVRAASRLAQEICRSQGVSWP